ncbi:MAG: DEAD/DEAH box helicase family protein [Chloroflexi bacterium]|nr:DEAD/DEAH box helicase family protein [Chloroflexota bacterium]
MPGGLRDYPFQISYGAGDDRLHGFYLPALERSISYDRSAGFFSSSALAVAAAGVARLIQNGGRMRLLVGAALSPEDVAAIVAGHDLAERIASLYLVQLPDPADLLLRQRLEALAWMIAAGTLEIRVVLPLGPDGAPLPADRALDYYHPKAGVFTDAVGDQVAFSGSINESAQAWLYNYEQFMVYRSWDATRPYLAQVVQRFERLWRGAEPGWIALPIPEAVRQRLITFRPDQAPHVDPLEGRDVRPSGGVREVCDVPYTTGDHRERLLVQFLRDAPFLPNASRLGAATAPVVPWPHQDRIADALVARYPESFLVADEVGLGKTIEAGLAIRQLLISGRVRRCLILTPKSVLRQWQEELYEKFALDVPRFDGTAFWTVFGEEWRPTTANPFDGVSIALASSQLMKRRERQTQLCDAAPWDLIVVDEAHHARRKDFLDERFRPNRLLELLLSLRDRTRSFLLLTATPMQVHPVEVWDLLTLLGMGGRWGADQDNFLRFFSELRRDFAEVDWNFVFDMVRDFFATGGTLDELFARAAQQRIGLVEWQQVQSLPDSTRRDQILKQLSLAGRAVAVEFAKRHTPLRRFVFRNTRSLLREYRRRGILQANVPQRDPRLEWIPMRPAERALYDRIEEYIADFYARYEAERKGLGFIMTVYRRRLTSSFSAIARSLERRLAYLQGRANTPGLDDDDLEQDDLERDVTEELAAVDRQLFRDEIAYVEDFLHDLAQLSTDSKLEWLLDQLREIFRQRETVVIFTQYTDTMDYLREQLRQVYGSQVACYSGRGGEEWRGGEWVKTTKEEIKNAFRRGDRIKILVCTEAASEGLNLQTCGVLINYDMPWNPMRVEQRIGRIDRIGQRYPVVWVRNYFYEDTIEATVYRRLSDRIDWFRTVVGDLQPILSRVARSIQTLAMLPGTERRRRLEDELAALRAEIDQQDVALLKLDEFLEAEPIAALQEVPVTLGDLERILTQAPSLREQFRPHPTIDRAYLLQWGDGVTAVTFDRAVFDEHPATVRLLTYGERLLDELLSRVAPAAPAPDAAGLLRCATEAPRPLRGYYRPADTRVLPIDRLAAVEALGTGAAGLAWTDEQRAEAEAAFRAQVAAAAARERAAADARRRAERETLGERARQVLLRAALVELALGQRPDLFSDTALPWEFSEEAVRGLRRHRFPFAPLLHLVDTTGLTPSATDPYFLACQNDSVEGLRRRFEQLRAQAADLVRQLAAAAEQPAAPAEETWTVESLLLAVPRSPQGEERASRGVV